MAQCERLAQLVLSNKGLWRERDGFWTLGAATYQDDPRIYPMLADSYRGRQLAVFGGWLRDVYTALPYSNICTPSGFALPGFHIFDHGADELQGHPHIDEPYERVIVPEPFIEAFSFTIAVELPDGIGGLDFWPEHTDAAVEAYIETGRLPEPDYFRYDLGVMVLHDGLTTHRIANPIGIKDGQYRITLQGHGLVLVSGKTIVYF